MITYDREVPGEEIRARAKRKKKNGNKQDWWMIQGKVGKMGMWFRGERGAWSVCGRANGGSFSGGVLLMVHPSQKRPVCGTLKGLEARPSIKACHYDWELPTGGGQTQQRYSEKAEETEGGGAKDCWDMILIVIRLCCWLLFNYFDFSKILTCCTCILCSNVNQDF